MDNAQAERDEESWSNWMRLAQQGDQDSYQSLLEALGVAIEAYLRKRFGPVDYVDDIVQESLLAIHQARHTYMAGRPFRPWMFAIVRYKAIDMLRKRQVRDAHIQDGANSETMSHFSDHQAMGENAEALMEGAELFVGIKPQSRQALILTKVLGLSLREAAVKLGISEVAMKVRVHRALQELRNYLNSMK